jgi:hypothetical protein
MLKERCEACQPIDINQPPKHTTDFSNLNKSKHSLAQIHNSAHTTYPYILQATILKTNFSVSIKFSGHSSLGVYQRNFADPKLRMFV